MHPFMSKFEANVMFSPTKELLFCIGLLKMIVLVVGLILNKTVVSKLVKVVKSSSSSATTLTEKFLDALNIVWVGKGDEQRH